MVEFRVPPSQGGCEDFVVKGIVGGIDVDTTTETDGTQDTTMRLSIMDVACLGQQDYCSGNLADVVCAGENSSDLNRWQVSALSTQANAGVSGESFLFVEGSGRSELIYDLEVIPGDVVTWSFDYEYIFGGQIPVTFNIDGPGVFTSLIGNGTASNIFFASELLVLTGNRVSLQWELPSQPGGAPTYFVFKNLVVRSKGRL